MNDSPDSAPNIAIFCDYENVAIGVRDAKYEAFNIEMILERLLDKGKIVVKKAYADWDRFKSAKRSMHEAAFEMIEIPHVSYSGKNSADIRLVVDALDLSYVKSHIDVFVIVSGDSDFSPLVSKLRENAKVVIGLGVKNSSSDLLIDNCDEFIYYDDLDRARRGAKRSSRKPRKSSGRDRKPAQETGRRPDAKGSDAKGSDSKGSDSKGGDNKVDERSSEDRNARESQVSSHDDVSPEELTKRRNQGLDYLLDTVESLFQDRDGSIWGSMVKQTLKRKKPNFSERFHGYRTFTEMLQDAQDRGLLELSKDGRSGGYLITSFGPNA